MGSRAIKALLTVVAASLVLTGCARTPATLGSVNGTSISSAQLERTVDGCAEAFQQSSGQSLNAAQARYEIAVWLVVGEMARQVEAQSNVTVTDREIDDYLQSKPGIAAMRSNAQCEQVLSDLARYQIIGMQLQKTPQWTEYMANVDVEINPRYGIWNPQSLEIVPVYSGALARPVEKR